MSNSENYHADVIIVGGGIGGLWALNRLSQIGYHVILLEKRALGSGQTMKAQGIIHGGIKYALAGKLTGEATAIANMPDRWQACLVFAKKIKDGDIDCSSLEKMIDGIFEGDEITKSKFHQFRNDLNPDSHIITTNNEEDIRSFASDMMNYLYSLKFEVAHE